MNLTVLKKNLPWWTKVGTKLVLSRIPVDYSVWQRLGLFRHGYMDQASYALQVFQNHVNRAGLEGQLRGKCILEMGPGDSIATAIISYAYGSRAVLIDAGVYAKGDARNYTSLCELLSQHGLLPPDLTKSNDIPSVLAACGGEYHTRGLLSWRELPSDSFDFVFSQAVLEHIRKRDFLETLRQCFRVLKPGGITSHRVDLRDHLGGALNNLRFREQIWESNFFFRSGFYTNRISYRNMMDLFCESGWQIENVSVQHWSELPTAQAKMALPFRIVPKEELMVSGFDVVLKKAL